MSLPLFTLKDYQLQTLAALRKFLEKTVELSDADTAFYAVTKRPFTALPSLPGLPYVCLRIPTGGGKTILAAHSIGVAADSFLRTDTPAVLWLVPSQTIRDQTLATLQNRAHLSFPVSRMWQRWVRRSRSAVVILASPNTLAHSLKLRLVVMTTLVRS